MKQPRLLLHPLTAVHILLALLAGTAATEAAHAQVIVLTPPPMVREVRPPPRPGFAWRSGYWGWRYGRYVWMPGRWIAVQPVGVPMPPPPPPTPQVAQVLRFSADALFAFDRGGIFDILPGGRAQIRDAAARLSGQYARIDVRGYTDRLGSSAHNLQLSRQRAESVKALLVQNGIPADHIRAQGLAAADPVSTCHNGLPRAALIKCLQPDRRVEIVIYANDEAGRAQYPDGGTPAYPAYPDNRPAPYPGAPYPQQQYPQQYPQQQYPQQYPQYPGYPGYPDRRDQ